MDRTAEGVKVHEDLLKISQSVYDEMRRHGEDTYPHECCGVLLGTFDGDDARTVKALARAGNTRTDSPENRYNIDPRELVKIQREGRERSFDIVGFYHSHPDHPAQWSSTDLAEAHWIGCSYVITSVRQNAADQTRSFVLCGTDEESKRFESEELIVD